MSAERAASHVDLVGRRFDTIAIAVDDVLGNADPLGRWPEPYERGSFLADAADVIAQYDYRPALPALKQLYSTPRPSLRWVDLHILQLEGDVVTLERRTRDKDAAGGNAVRALYRMHACDALSRIAADPKHPRSVDARHYLGFSVRL